MITKAQLVSLLVATGVGVAGATLVKTSGTAAPKALLIHTVRVEFAPAPGTIIAYRTEAIGQADGGVEFQDDGPARCTGDLAALRTLAQSCYKSGAVTVLEMRPATNSAITLEVYGSFAHAVCAVEKAPALQTILSGLKCQKISTSYSNARTL